MSSQVLVRLRAEGEGKRDLSQEGHVLGLCCALLLEALEEAAQPLAQGGHMDVGSPHTGLVVVFILLSQALLRLRGLEFSSPLQSSSTMPIQASTSLVPMALCFSPGSLVWHCAVLQACSTLNPISVIEACWVYKPLWADAIL